MKRKIPAILVILTAILLSAACIEQDGETLGPQPTSIQTAPPQTDEPYQSPLPTTLSATKEIQSPPMETVPAATTTHPPTSPPVVTIETKPPESDDYYLEKVSDGYSKPLYLTHSGDGTDRIFIVEQRGVIWILDRDRIQIEAPFLDISDRVRNRGEQGLLGLAFHPLYRENGHFFLHYSSNNGDTVISRFTVSEDPNIAEADSEEILLTEEQPYANHNGGQIAFGPDGDLYIGLGDGGSGGDPLGNGQNTNTLLGAILRIDLDEGYPYSIPDSNPFKDTDKGRPEIWAYGLRNPWRFSFDSLTGDLYIGDVGQNQWEEINYQPANSEGGENYGWNPMEGNHCYRSGCGPEAYIPPVAEYGHKDGCSVTGGYVYRGSLDPNLRGFYLYGDYCSGRICSLRKSES